MHGVGAKAARDRVRAYDIGLDGQRHPVLGEAPGRIRGGIQVPNAAGGIFQCGFHRVPPVEDRRAGGQPRGAVGRRSRRWGVAPPAWSARLMWVG